MNEDIKIRVQTPVGTTKEEKVGCIVGQGTNEGNIISSVSIDGGVKEKFHDKEEKETETKYKESYEKITYGNIMMKPMCFIDDLLNATKSVKAAQIDNLKM